VAATGYDPQRRSLQQDSRPTPSHGNYPRRRSLQVEDWRAAPNPLARTSDTLGAAEASVRPVPGPRFGDAAGDSEAIQGLGIPWRSMTSPERDLTRACPPTSHVFFGMFFRMCSFVCESSVPCTPRASVYACIPACWRLHAAALLKPMA